jgi:hypothetical protein
VHSQLFYKLPESLQPAAMTAYEYWTDADFAGKRQGTLSGQSATVNELDFQSLGEGLHILHIRVLDNLGQYSSVHSQLFYKLPESDPSLTMTAYEYWTDADFAGKRQGTLSGQSATVNELDFQSLGEGLHVLHIRALDNLGRYSPVHSQLFYKIGETTGENETILYEYWFNDEFAARTVKETSGKIVTVDNLFETTALSEGFHTVSIRAKDAYNHWSVTHTQGFYINGIAPEGGNKIEAYRYWYDNQFDDHVFTLLNVAVNPYELDEWYTLPDTFAEGEEHLFHIQFRDALGSWSTIASDTFRIVALSGTEIDLVAVNSMLLYPNPVVDILSITGAEDAALTVFNLQGQIIYVKNKLSVKENIPVSSWAKGVYLVALQTENGRTVNKIIKE